MENTVMGFINFLLRFQVSLLLLLLAFLNACTGSYSAVPVQPDDDILGLIVFKSNLIDPSSSLRSWNQDDSSPCSWQFVGCSSVSGRVSQVSLDGLGLSGRIGEGLRHLQHLKVLSLSHNNFSGEISHELGLLTNLERLNLSHNNLSGLIPPLFGNMSSLRFLDISENSLSGPLPDDFFHACSSLRYLSVAGNSLQGPIPSTLSGCRSLSTVNLSSNHFSGNPDFSTGIWSLKRLRTLDLSHNEFSGTLPKGVSALYFLNELTLQGNRFSGPLPVDIGLCPHLTRVELSDNLFNGELPSSIQRLRSLSYLGLSRNVLTGDFPRWIGNLTNLEYMGLSGNGLTGSLPSSIGNLKSLFHLSLSNNKLIGHIPTSLVYCTSLSVIRLRGNSFNGSIPEGLFDLELEEVDLSNNGFTGSIPPMSGKFSASIHTLDLSRNNLTGHFPAEMRLSSNLRYLNLSWNNNLGSRMPAQLGHFQNLTFLDLRSSELVGSIPSDICDSGSLNILQLDGNSLTGSIPEEIGNCSSLYLLSLSHNNLNGLVPESISRLKKLKILNLEVNELSGEIPQVLGNLENLLAVNISYNKLTGRLPVGGIFPSLDKSALQGNVGLCSPLLKGPCKLNLPKPLVLDPNAYGNQMKGHRERDVPSSGFHHRRFLSFSAIIAISAAALIALGVMVICLLNISARKRLAFLSHALESMCSSSSESGNLQTGKLVLFDSKSSPDYISNPDYLLGKAAEIGQGEFGTVYKVPVGSEGPMVAIKKLVTSNIIQYPSDFDREVRVLGKARHPNLLSLKGYYWTPQLQLLISEYAPNGSLQAKLHERLPSSPALSWPNRFKIVLGTAKGLAYLHHSFRPPTLHYNLKPSNILLDENLNPKISDFGLARLLTKLDEHVIRSRFQSALGYVAPELACQSLRINEKCDIYSFGVLILELVTGRRAVEYGEDNVVILHDRVRALLEEGNVLDCVDPSMGDVPEDEVLPVLKLALVCTSQIPSSRPSMSEVVQILQFIKTPIPQRMEIF